MSQLTGPCQASFIPGRATSDNIVVAQEIIHSLRKRKGRNGAFILKVDLEMAYDQIDWGFLEQVLHCSGFNLSFRRLIMDCIASTPLSVC